MDMITTVRGRRRRPAAILRIRPLRRDDLAVDAVFDGLSPQSRYLRFHGPTPRLTGSVRRHLLDVDGRSRAALVAEARTNRGWRTAGIARLIAVSPGRAELAVAVVDAWQGRGVGRRLVAALGDLARDLGYRELYGDALRENTHVVRLLRSVFSGARLSWSSGVVRITCPLDRDIPAGELTHDDLLADLLAC